MGFWHSWGEVNKSKTHRHRQRHRRRDRLKHILYCVVCDSAFRYCTILLQESHSTALIIRHLSSFLSFFLCLSLSMSGSGSDFKAQGCLARLRSQSGICIISSISVYPVLLLHFFFCICIYLFLLMCTYTYSLAFRTDGTWSLN